MRSRTSHIVVAVALLVCLVCPVVEMFEHWDHTIQTGQDTEYELVVLALCVGLTYSFARFIFKCTLLDFLARTASTSGVHQVFLSMPWSFTSALLDEISPPTLTLRI